VNKNVLVIEDNEQNLYLTRFLLEKHGFIVHEARDGLKGIAMARTLRPHLILLDIQLPSLDGYSVAAELRKDPALRDTPIIAVTSYAMPGDREKAVAAGATDYIEKPIDPSTFVERVRSNLPSEG
jgi:CheY-like chemotaxis protein